MIMENLTLLKLKLSVLWIIMGVAFYRCTSFLDPGEIERIIAGEYATLFQTPEMLLIITLQWLIPLLMAYLSLTLKDKTNRWTNIILGIVFTGLNIVHLIIHFTLLAPTVHQVLIVGSTVVVTALITWYAWKWK
jgi:hypothetical protein